MAVVHLLSRGLNEMGRSLNTSHDQRYITSREYADEIQFADTSKDKDAVSEEILDIIARRLLARDKAD